jgi:hypothetical protein
VATTPVPPGFLPDTWAGSETVQVDLTLGQINQLAIERVTLTVPSTVAGSSEPRVPLTMLGLRVRLLLRSTPPGVRDQAWRDIGQRARAERGEWNLFALGSPIRDCAPEPGGSLKAWHPLRPRRCISDSRGTSCSRCDGSTSPGPTSPPGSSAPPNQASGRKQRARSATVSLGTAARLAHSTAGWPEPSPRSVLDRLVRQTRHAKDGQRLTGLHAELIARTYLDGEKLKDVAGSLGMRESKPPSTARAPPS